MGLEAAAGLAKELAYKIGERIKSSGAKPESIVVHSKGKNDVVTDVDLWAEKTVIDAVSTSFPEHNILSEEMAPPLMKDREKLRKELGQGVWWVVDPLDGTQNFLSGVPLCAVSIALLQDGKPVFGVVYDPFQNELYTATSGNGAYCNNAPLRASSASEASRCLVSTGFSNDDASYEELYLPLHRQLVAEVRKVRVFGSAVVELCWVAAGRLDATFLQSPKPWDLAAASLILSEAGGELSSFSDTRPFDLFSTSVLASSGGVHRALLDIVTG